MASLNEIFKGIQANGAAIMRIERSIREFRLEVAHDTECIQLRLDNQGQKIAQMNGRLDDFGNRLTTLEGKVDQIIELLSKDTNQPATQGLLGLGKPIPQ